MTQSDELDLAALKATASKATQGKWRRGIGNDCYRTFDQHGNVVIEHTGTNNNDFVSTFDPPTVLRLIAALEAAQARSQEAHNALANAFGQLVNISLLTDLGGEVDDYAEVTASVRRLADSRDAAQAALADERKPRGNGVLVPSPKLAQMQAELAEAQAALAAAEARVKELETQVDDMGHTIVELGGLIA